MLLVTLLALASGAAWAALGAAGGSKPAKPKITAGPAKLTNQTAAALAYTSKSAVVFLCSLDAGAFAMCGSGTTGSTAYAGPLAEGMHRFQVEAQDGARTGKPRTWTWRVDTQPPPAPTFTKKPPSSTTEKSASFKYRDGEPGVSYSCKLDGAGYGACGGKMSYRNLAAGAHAFCVRALDKAGNASPAACSGWLVGVSSASFSVGGGPAPGALLYPGAAAVPLDLVFTNPNPAPITIQSVTVTVAGTSAAGCSAANFGMAQQLQANPTVPGGTTASLQSLGVAQSDWPQLRMLDAGNQDACRNATVDLSFTGTATG
ncbi:MAG TPA: hypothetical protein VH816_00120 [Gaiellaceae bacterium]